MMQPGDIVYVYHNGEIREGEFRSPNNEQHPFYEIWMAEESAAGSKFRIFTFFKDYIYTDLDEIKKLVFRMRLKGYHK